MRSASKRAARVGQIEQKQQLNEWRKGRVVVARGGKGEEGKQLSGSAG